MSGRTQVSWNLGQIDEEYWKRFDYADTVYYGRSAQLIKNGLVTQGGVITRRPGTEQYLNVTQYTAGTQEVSYFMFNAFLADKSIITYACLRVGISLYIGVVGTTLSLSRIDLTSFTQDQIKEAYFDVLGKDIVVCHPQVATIRITFDGTTFSQSPFLFSTPALWDDGTIDYSNVNVVIAPSSTAGDPTTITLTPDVFGDNAPKYVGGFIVGPGNDPYSPFGTGTINSMTVSEGSTVIVVNPNTTFAAKTSSSNAKGSDLSIQRPILNPTDGYMGFFKSFKNRAWWGGHPLTPQTIFGTVLGTENNLDLGVGDPTDAVIYTLSINALGRILYFNVGTQFEIYTEKGLLTLYQNLQGGVTPTTYDLKPQTQNSPVSTVCRPISFKEYSFYAGVGSALYAINQSQSGDENQYNSVLQSGHATSLVPNPKKLASFLGVDGSSIVLAILNQNGTLSLYTLNDANEIQAWTTFAFTDGFTILDLDSNGGDLFLLVYYEYSQQTIIEKLDTKANFFVDHAVPILVSANDDPQQIAIPNTLNNYSLYATTNSKTAVYGFGSLKVSNYAITIPKQSISNTLYFGIDSGFEVRTMFFYEPSYILDSQTSYNYKSLNRFYLDYVNSLALTVDGYPVPFDQISPINPVSGTYEYCSAKAADRFLTISISQYAPFSATIASMAYFINVSPV